MADCDKLIWCSGGQAQAGDYFSPRGNNGMNNIFED